MAIIFEGEHDRFQWRVSSTGAPVGEVQTIGGVRWLMCCPLCGAAHDLAAVKGATFTPRCTAKASHKMVYKDWLKKHPASAEYDRVQLVEREA